MKLYIAGPMTNRPWHNFPAFDVGVELLEREGFEVVSPAELDNPEERAAAITNPTGTLEGPSSWGDLLARDVKIVADVVDGVALLPGWEGSKGARLESFIARLVGKPIFYINDHIIDYAERSDWPPEASVEHEDVCHCLYDGGDGPRPLLIELDDAELDYVLTMADLVTLWKIERDERITR